MTQQRVVTQLINGRAATDGAGFELTRLIGQPDLPMLDPFLMLDGFQSDNPDDYIAGFPAHPHRGFETVTYLLAGKMRHEDSAGNKGVIEAGGIQWMTAGKGIVHSEMPEQEDGLLAGFQLWVNLPAEHKMDEPKYQEYGADEIPIEKREDGVSVKVIAGTTSFGTMGPVVQPLTMPLYLDVTLEPNKYFREPSTIDHNAFFYMVDGVIEVKNKDNLIQQFKRGDLAILSQGDTVEVVAGSKGGRLLLISGKPINEPVARGGPFVMTTKAEIEQAFIDYKAGVLV